MKKLIFLDCDGVVNSHGTFISHKGGINMHLWPIDPKLLANVQKIIDATGALIVISSDWRRHDMAYETIKSAIHGEVIGKTPRFYEEPRHVEISRWLALLHPDGIPYAVIDDADHAGGSHPFFQTTMRLGLTEAIADKVIAHLNGE